MKHGRRRERSWRRSASSPRRCNELWAGLWVGLWVGLFGRLPSKSMKKLAGTTRLELATSAVTGQRSNQLNYVPSFVGKCRFRPLSVGQTVPDNLNSLTDNSAGRHSCQDRIVKAR